MGVQCTLFRGLAQIHYGQTQAPFSVVFKKPVLHPSLASD